MIIDNGSSDGTPAHVRERWPSVRLLGGSGNLGFAKANNVAIRETASDLVLLLNPDVIVSPGSIDALVAALGRHPEAAVMTRRQKQVDWVSGACLLIRRSDLEAVRLLDERFFMYAEDVDLCAAVRARGRIVLFTPDAEVVHLRGRSVASAPRATHAAYRRSHLAFYDKHHPGWAPFLRLYLRLRGELPDT